MPVRLVLPGTSVSSTDAIHGASLIGPVCGIVDAILDAIPTQYLGQDYLITNYGIDASSGLSTQCHCK